MVKGLKIAVASGKGGTGKTTVATNLAVTLAASEDRVVYVDCDVEEPNGHLFLRGDVSAEEVVGIPIPVVDTSVCDGCAECSRFCQYNAIVCFGSEPLVFPELCHGCGGCVSICPRQAISETDRRIGIVQTIQAKHVKVIQGRLDVGVAIAPPLIRAVKAHLKSDMVAILDAPPGTSCPVISTLLETDVIVLVTEPTPFGLHDLKLTVEMLPALGIPFGVVINRVGIGDDRVHNFCEEQGIPILMEIPDDRRIAEAYSRGVLMVDALPEYLERFEQLLSRTEALYGAEKGACHADK